MFLGVLYNLSGLIYSIKSFGLSILFVLEPST